MEHRLQWAEIHRHWRRRLEEFAVSLSPFFVQVHIKDPAGINRPDEQAWCLRSEIDTLVEKQQSFLDEMPGRQGLVLQQGHNFRRGELHTLKLLWQHNSNPEAISAVLLSASLFTRLNSSAYPEAWPAYADVCALNASIESHWHGQIQRWSLNCTAVLPVNSRDFDYAISREIALIRYLAEEHASLLRLYAPVNVRYS